MKTKRLLLLLLLAAVFLCGLSVLPVHAAYENSFDFLSIPESGVTEIASGSGLSTIEGIGSVLGNPAGFASSAQKSLMISDTENIADTRKIGLFFGQKLPPFNIIGGIRYFYLKDGVEFGNRKLDYDSITLDVLLARTFRLLGWLDTGLHVSYASSSVGTYGSSLLLFQPGFMLGVNPPVLGKSLRRKSMLLGLYLSGLGLTLGSGGAKENPPMALQAGLTYHFLQIKYAASALFVNYIQDFVASGSPRAGMRFSLFGFLDLSAAYRFDSSVSPVSFGLGVNYVLGSNEYRFGYTVMPVPDLDPVHCISLIVNI